MKNIILTIIGVICVAVLAMLAFVYSGVYNVGADDADSAAKEWLLGTTMERSVANHADDVEVPDLSGDERLLSGAADYDAMCVSCHGAPGREHADFASHLNPKPPDFGEEPEEVEEWSAAELFWITKHGVEATGMPAWGELHSDEEIWNMVALMQRLPELSAQEYAQLLEDAQSQGHQHEHGDGHAH